MDEIMILPKGKLWVEAAMELFLGEAIACIADRGWFSVALSGGSTPKAVYAALGAPEKRGEVCWEKVHLFWGDERHVPPDDPKSNFRMVREALLDHVPIPDDNVHRVPAELDVRKAAWNYEAELRGHFSGDWPSFDLVFLGMGEDGHTASLFPYSSGLNEEDRWFIENFSSENEAWRLTLTRHAINAARLIVVLVQGKSKAEMLKTVLTGPVKPGQFPIQLIRPVDGRMVWLTDDDAAGLLPLDFRDQFPASDIR